MKKFVLCLIFIIVISLSCVYASNFSDLSQEHWAYEAVNKMVELNIVNGYPDGTFKPQGKITRAEFAKILVLSLGLEEKSNVEFTDVKSDYWGYDYIKIASNYLTGYNNNGKLIFLPDMQAVREDMAVAIVIAQNLQNATYDLETLDRFTDKNEISKDLQKYIAIAVENGLMKGNADGTFNPQGELTRAEASQLILNTLEVKEKIAINELEKGKYKKIDNSKDIVYEVIKYNVGIPCINLDYDEVKNLNNELIIVYKNWDDIDYTYNIYRNILSLKIWVNNISPYQKIDSYNIDIYTGQVVSDNNILCKKLNIDKDKYLLKVKENATKIMEELWKDNKEYNESFPTQYDEWVKWMERYNYIVNDIYIDENNDIYAFMDMPEPRFLSMYDYEIFVCNLFDIMLEDPLIDDSKDIVYDKDITKQIDGKVPFINLIGKDAESANAEIENIIKSDAVNIVNYSYYIYKDEILSILLVTNPGNDAEIKYYTFNFDLTTNNRLNKSDLFVKLKIHIDEYNYKILHGMEEQYLTYDEYAVIHKNVYIDSNEKIHAILENVESSISECKYFDYTVDSIDNFNNDYFLKTDSGLLTDVVTLGDYVNYYNNDGTMDDWRVLNIIDGKIALITDEPKYTYYYGEDIDKALKDLTIDFVKVFGGNLFNAKYAENIQCPKFTDGEHGKQGEIYDTNIECWTADESEFADNELVCVLRGDQGLMSDKNATKSIRPMVILKENITATFDGYKNGVKCWNISF